MSQPSAEDGSVSTSLPKVTNEGEDTSSTATLIQAKATEDDTPCGPQLMTQEEMEHALAELQNAEEDLGRYGPSLAGRKSMTCSSTGGKMCRRWVARRRVILCELLQQVANTDV